MTADQTTRAFLLEQRDRCPCLRPRDLLKALHQSVFGCGHFVTDEAAGLALLRRETAMPSPAEGPEIEALDGPFCRVHLRYLSRRGLSPETLFRLFALSSRRPGGTAEDLEAKLARFLSLARENAFPFTEEEARQAVSRWRQEGFPACRHSEEYRAALSPAYRVICREYVPLLPVLARLDRLLSSRSRVIAAIEGGSASGKTTLASLLAELYCCTVFHMDDFFLRPEQRTPERYAEPGGNVDRERFLAEVLTPLKSGGTVCYRPYDCRSRTVRPGRIIRPEALCIVEGAYSMHPDLAEEYDLSVFLDISPDLQRRRVLERNGEAMGENFFSRWIPLEREYFRAMRVRERCDCVLEVKTP